MHVCLKKQKQEWWWRCGFVVPVRVAVLARTVISTLTEEGVQCIIPVPTYNSETLCLSRIGEKTMNGGENAGYLMERQ